MHALRDRLPVEEVAQLGAQLPMLIRGFYYEGWVPSEAPLKVRHQDEFLALINRRSRDDEFDTALVARAVFAILSSRIADGEVEDVRRLLPTEIRQLLP